MKKWHLIVLILAVLGIFDAGYLTWEHFTPASVPCHVNPWMGDCGRVLTSKYSIVVGVPLALVGLIHYTFLSGVLTLALFTRKSWPKFLAIVLAGIGFVSSLYFVYLQVWVIGAICIFCMGSALTSTLLFVLVLSVFSVQRKQLIIRSSEKIYKLVGKKIFFLFPPVVIHENMTAIGRVLGRVPFARWLFATCFVHLQPALEQNILGIDFLTPVGLAAGFDYDAQLPQLLPSLGFGFGSVGTITQSSYEGNMAPMLGRLPKSRSLMVNKGFKNLGAKKTINILESQKVTYPLGVSIGRTNTNDLDSQLQSVADICAAFEKFEKSRVSHQYYELNISCPNLKGSVEFYTTKNLEQLLKAVDQLTLSRPLFVKMPIEKSDEETRRILDVLAKHNVQGIIIGNLQKNRKDPALHPNEVAQFPVGNFSGKPTFERSNQLILLAFREFGKRFIIIGCGGVFNADDAYLKIKLGASLIQLITGLIFEGPQVIADINFGLSERLARDGYTHISQAIGTQRKYQSKV